MSSLWEGDTFYGVCNGARASPKKVLFLDRLLSLPFAQRPPVGVLKHIMGGFLLSRFLLQAFKGSRIVISSVNLKQCQLHTPSMYRLFGPSTNACSITPDVIKKYDSFDDMKLSDDLLRGIYSCGFEKPSAIQSLAIVATIR